MRHRSALIVCSVFVAAVTAVGLAAVAHQPSRYEADVPASRVVIEGTSTMHDWEAAGPIEGFLQLPAGALDVFWQEGAAAFERVHPVVQVTIPVEALTSGKKGLDKNLRKALDTAAHPTITYELTTARLVAVSSATQLDLETEGRITVAGVTQSARIPMQLERVAAGRYHVTGSTTLRMTDFNVRPPKAMLGAIRAGDEITVEWTWVVQASP